MMKEEVSDVSDVLMSNVKLEQLEMDLAGDSHSKKVLLENIDSVHGTILPMHLQFNDLIQSLSYLEGLDGGSDKSNISAEEKFGIIRGKLLALNKNLQDVSTSIEKLQPLFRSVQEYSVKYNDKQFQPMEKLRIGFDHEPVVAASIPPATKPAENSSRKSRSNAATPVSNTNTPLPISGTASSPSGNSTASAKKARNPRQSKKNSVSGKKQFAPSPLNAQMPINSVNSNSNLNRAMASNLNMKSAPTPQMANNSQLTSNVSPNSTMNKLMSNMFPADTPSQDFNNAHQAQQHYQSQPQNIQKQQHQNTPQQQQMPQQIPSNKIAQQTPVMNMNITPANILSMSMPTEQPQMKQQINKHQSPSQMQQQPQSLLDTNEFDLLDLNNLDFGGNIDFMS